MYESNQGSSCWFLGDLEDLGKKLVSRSQIPKEREHLLSRMGRIPCSFLIGDVVISPRSLDARETELTKMHPGDQKPFRTDHIQQSRSRLCGEMCILIERDRHIRP